MNATREEWRPVVGREGLYEVSSRGRVRSLDRMVRTGHGGKGSRKIEGRILKPWARPPIGYLTIRFGHRGPSQSVHRMVLEAFVGPCPPGMECLHGNDDPTDNRLANLRWGTRSANKIDAVKNGIHPNARKTHCKRGHEFTSENTLIKAHGGRQCRECLRIGARRRYAAAK